MAKKLQEAEENLAKADKLMKTSVFRWSPDYMSAAPYLEKAAECFRAAQDYARASTTFVRLAEVQHKNQASFRAAMHMETAAKLHLQYAPKKPVAAMQYYQTASGYYAETGELGKAAEMLMKGASALEEVGYTDVKQMYLDACELMEAQDKPHFAVDVFRKTAAFLVKRKEYDEAIANYNKQITFFQAIQQPDNMYKAFTSIVVLHLAKPDVVAADQAYMQHLQDDGYLHADECALSEDLIGAFKRGDEDALKALLKKPNWQYLDAPIGRLARTLTMYSTARVSKPARPAAPPSQPAPKSAPEPVPAPVPAAMAAPVEPKHVSEPVVAPAVVPVPAPTPIEVAAPVVSEEPEFDLT
ncbi:unnamed protein product [Aphanomyces euteiches]|uniref:Gamma-soluble NSF attachment protein n=1 Tax=Aphanomyces euteiches TaxID=100861 RepID=A0A6G0WNT2_9STRA|nr:hypothetical protein Ae201684_013317 [Aphanomyces euteiches]KAH9064905.1 hypothetical protein Ae201684P_003684 [Aphanomyces euteiches]KAH9143535.1 hypothetical protein AeRB84_012482 [Aphanomyces euteiches]